MIQSGKGILVDADPITITMSKEAIDLIHEWQDITCRLILSVNTSEDLVRYDRLVDSLYEFFPELDCRHGISRIKGSKKTPKKEDD